MDAAVLVEGVRQVEGASVVGEAGRVEGFASRRSVGAGSGVGLDPADELHLAAVGLEGAARRVRIALVVVLLAGFVALAAFAGLLT